MPTPSPSAKYADPYRSAEFRMFLLNLCNKGCKGCFYKKDGNTFGSFESALQLSTDLHEHGYNLETCYLLPTDFFDNEANKDLFFSNDFVELVSKFKYVGVASTLIDPWDASFFDTIFKQIPTNISIELQVNMVINHLFEPTYEAMLEHKIKKILNDYPSTVVNLAINVGFNITPLEITHIHRLINKLSVDKLVEVNFTFLYNDSIPTYKKSKMLIESYDCLREFANLYVEAGDPRYNSRTLLRKPAFVFRDGKIYVPPIIPFDEYVFSSDDKYALQKATLEGFLDTISLMETTNLPILDECDACDNLQLCHSKGFFTIARELKLPCFKQENKNANIRY